MFEKKYVSTFKYYNIDTLVPFVNGMTIFSKIYKEPSTWERFGIVNFKNEKIYTINQFYEDVFMKIPLNKNFTEEDFDLKFPKKEKIKKKTVKFTDSHNADESYKKNKKDK